MVTTHLIVNENFAGSSPVGLAEQATEVGRAVVVSEIKRQNEELQHVGSVACSLFHPDNRIVVDDRSAHQSASAWVSDATVLA